MAYTIDQEAWILNQIKKSVNSFKMIEQHSDNLNN